MCGFHYGTVSIETVVLSNGMMIDGLENIWKEAVMAA
jgi:hypothetical protein